MEYFWVSLKIVLVWFLNICLRMGYFYGKKRFFLLCFMICFFNYIKLIEEVLLELLIYFFELLLMKYCNLLFIILL